MEITFYDEFGTPRVYNITKDNLVGTSGSTGSVHRVSENTCLKIMDPGCSPSDVFELLKELNVPNFVSLKDRLVSDSHTLAYTMEYAEKSDTSILHMPVEYTVDNFCSIFSSVKILTYSGIKLEDLAFRNIIVGPQRIMVVDFDSYLREAGTFFFNVDRLLETFKALYMFAAQNDPDILCDQITLFRLVEYLFDPEGNCFDVASVISKKISRVKKPIDLFRKVSI